WHPRTIGSTGSPGWGSFGPARSGFAAARRSSCASHRSAGRDAVVQGGDMSSEHAQSGLPPQGILYQLGIGHYFSNALHVAAKLGIAELLKDGPRRVTALAEATGTHAPSLNRVLRLLASVGVFEEREDGSFALTAVGECLRPGIPGSARAM